MSPLKGTQPGRVAAWPDGGMIFERAPLAEVAREISRYHPVEFRFADPAPARRPVTGSFETGNPPLIPRTLQSALSVKAERIDPK